ncbi:MAG: hypothetical protein CM15mP83_0820 [Flavobacteriaceae bacterium]|nr:MAG: hypothetical protein CM15mP83_0820 [Flavobacteriaceae bacterium]
MGIWQPISMYLLLRCGDDTPLLGFSPFGQNNHLLADRESFPKIPTSAYGKVIPKGYKDAMRTISPEEVIEWCWIKSSYTSSKSTTTRSLVQLAWQVNTRPSSTSLSDRI